MADYYSILKKTIASLPENNGGARRSVYSRARNAIVSQLKAYEPPLSPSEITAEQLRLEEAIRKVEAEAARESLGLGPATKAPPVAPSPPPAATESAPAAAPAAPQAPAAPAPAATPPPAATPEPEAPVAKATEPQPPVSPLKETVAEADELGAASRKAVETVKEAATPKGDDAPAQRQEPVFAAGASAADDGIFEENGTAPKEPRVDTPAPGGGEAKGASAKSARKVRSEGRVADRLRSGAGDLSMGSLGLVAVLVLIVLGIGGIIYSQRDMITEMIAGDPAATGETASSVQQTSTPAATEPSAEGTADEKKPGKIADRLLDNNGEPAAAPDARTVTTTTITPGAPEPNTAQPAATAPAAPEPSAPIAATPEPAVPAPAAPAAAVPTPSTPAIVASQNPAPAPAAPADTQPETTVAAVDQTEQAPPAASNESIPVATRSILYEEGTGSTGAGTASQGEVVWSVEEESDLEGTKRTVLTAAIRIPERDMTVDIRIKPNDDASLPASHLVEIKYGLPEGFSGGDVQNVPGLVMKPTEQARGDALLGASVKVSPGYFWIALSSIQSELERNIGLLRERGWIDIPMLYDNGRRGILTLEKGRSGTRAVEQAVQAWQAS